MTASSLVRSVPGDAMLQIRMSAEDDVDEWKRHARSLLAQGIAPHRLSWCGPKDTGDLFAQEFEGKEEAPMAISVPKSFDAMASAVALHNAPERWGLLYQALTIVQRDRTFIHNKADPLMLRLHDMAKQVGRDKHKMRAFVRFREVEGRYVAWFEPDHHIVRANAAFFVNRFRGMAWSILTPEVSIHWDGDHLREGPGAQKSDAPTSDPVEDIWKSYYASIFNPARLKVSAMLKEMPRRYWKNMPETALIGRLIAGAQLREASMVAQRPAPTARAIGIEGLRAEAAACVRCPLHHCASQTVFGEGPADADIMIVGEQPGDEEDKAGRPFVGPAGKVLDRALAEAGIDRSRVYLTNAVKHFKHIVRGKRRLHERPNVGEIDMCRWWVEQERQVVKPRLIIMLGATAARSVTGRAVKISEAKGKSWQIGEAQGIVTIHPSYVLRLPDADRSAEEYRRLVDDLRAGLAITAA